MVVRIMDAGRKNVIKFCGINAFEMTKEWKHGLSSNKSKKKPEK